MTIKITLTLMIMQRGIAHIVDVKGAFLYKESLRIAKRCTLRFHWDLRNSTAATWLYYWRRHLYRLKQAAMGVLQEVTCGNCKYWALAKLGRPVPILQVGGRQQASIYDCVDQWQYDTWPKWFSYAVEVGPNETGVVQAWVDQKLVKRNI
jgi:hypothetical protein